MNKKMNEKQGNPISRREFVTHTAAGTAGMVIAPLTGLFAGNAEKSNWPADASKFQFHMIGHAHIDPVWLWPGPKAFYCSQHVSVGARPDERNP